MKTFLLLITFLIFSACIAQNDNQEIHFSLDSPDGLEFVNVKAETTILDGKTGIEVVKDRPDVQDETLVIIQFLSNGDAHQIEGDKVTLLKYSVPQINEEQRLMLVKIYESKDSVYDLYIQFSPLDQQARVAVVKDGVKTFEKWSYAGRPDLIAIANQYSHGKKPWISWDQILASKEYKDLYNRDRFSTRRNWEELFRNKNK